MVEAFFIILLSLICLAIGVLFGMKYNRREYYEGKLVIKRSDEGKQTFSLEMDADPYAIKDLDIITFKVVEEGYDD